MVGFTHAENVVLCYNILYIVLIKFIILKPPYSFKNPVDVPRANTYLVNSGMGPCGSHLEKCFPNYLGRWVCNSIL